MLKTNLLVLLAERRLKISKVSQDTGVSRTTLTALAQNRSQGIQLDTLDTICKYLHITPGEFFNFVPYYFTIRVEVLSSDKVGHNFSVEILVHASGSTHCAFFDGYTDEQDKKNITIDFYEIEPTAFPNEPNGNADTIKRFIKPLPPMFKNDLLDDIVSEILDRIGKQDAEVTVMMENDAFS